MAERKPVVLVGGQLRELPAGDTLSPQTPASHSHVTSDVSGLDAALAAKQDTLVSGTSIKTLGGVSLLGGGDIAAPESWQVGDVIQTSRTLSAPAWLPCDGGIYLQSSYAALYAELGLIPDVIPGDKLADPATLPTGTARGCSWDSSGTYLAVAHDSSPYITVYQRSGSTLTKLADPATLPVYAYGCSWGASGTYLAVAHDSSPYITVYKNIVYDEVTQFAVPIVSAGQNLATYIKV